VESQDNVDELRKDLLGLCKWSTDWLMLFNEDKCKVMHVGKNNLCATYSINTKELDSVEEERDLGIIMLIAE
jgi:hypothetical protein